MEERKVVFITGSTRGIGFAIAKKFAWMGFDIALNYSSENGRERAEKSIHELKELSLENKKEIQVKAYRGDISKSREIQEMVESFLKDWGKIDVLVNNAGITRDALSMRMTDEAWDEVIGVNLSGNFRLTRAFIPYMLKRREGNIVNLSSIVSLHGNLGQANYSASKAGVNALTKTLAKELASRNIIVNAVSPGAVETDMFNKLKEEIKKGILDSIPLKRAAKVEEVANLVFYLATQNYITGQIISIDGGLGI